MNNRRISLIRPSQVFDTFMDEFFNNTGIGTAFASKGSIQVNMHEDEKSLYIDIKAPGYSKDEVNIEVEDDTLKIHAKKESSTEENNEEKKFFVKEFSAEEEQRVVSLPVKVDSENVKAKTEDGIIKITMAKLPESKSKRISIDAE